MRMRAIVAQFVAAFVASAILLLTTAPAFTETVTYTYDIKGRLQKVDHGTTGPNAGVTANYTYDNADNRSALTSNAGSGTTTITLSPASLPNAAVGSSYTKTFTASGGTSPYTFSETGTLPAGLTFSSPVLSGTPSAAGAKTFTVTATDHNNNTGSLTYTLTVAAAISLSPATLPGGTVGTSYSAQISASGGTGPFTFTKSAGTLPTSLTLSSGGLFSGTPSAAGTYTFTAMATDNAGNTATKSYTVTIGSGGTTTIQLTSADHNLRTVANNNGYAGSTSANYTFVVGSGVTVTGASGSVGIDTGTWPAGVTLALQVSGTVRGNGGNGGNGGTYDNVTFVATSPTTGSAGGDSVQCHASIGITVMSGGTVQAGGGGGGGGGISNSNPAIVPGGGGGGGAPNGAGGAGGTGHLAGPAAAGSSGTTTGGGAGGSSGGIPGGSGGTYATAGAQGTAGNIYPGGAGGAAGYAVRKNGTGCTVTNNGTVTGTVG